MLETRKCESSARENVKESDQVSDQVVTKY
jgi:hypothetical protein